MAEALAIPSAVAGIASFAIQITQISFQYVSSVRNTSKAISAYLQELSALTSVLLRLRSLVDIPDVRDQLPARPDSLSCSALQDCEKELKSLKTRLEKRQSRTGFLASVKTLTWPFEERETKQLADMFQRFHAIFHAALSSDILYVLGTH